MAQAVPSIVGLGNPLLDISTEVTEELLQKYELSLNNAILAEEKHIALYHELVNSYQCDFIAGGATQNTIRVAQWMSQTHGTTAYFGCVGNDEFGERIRAAVTKDGVTPYYQVSDDTPTGTCAVLIKDRERSLVANISACNKFTVDYLRQNWSVIESAKIFYSAGFFLTVSPDSVEAVGKHAAETGKILGINIAALFIVEYFKDAMMRVYPYADYVFGNESEAVKFSEVHGFGTTDMKEIALRMSALSKVSDRPRTVVITQGKDPTIVAFNGTVQEFHVEPIAVEQIVDTNGAGDSFVGGFLSELNKGSDLSRCVSAGSYAAKEVIQRSGCTFPERPSFE